MLICFTLWFLHFITAQYIGGALASHIYDISKGMINSIVQNASLANFSEDLFSTSASDFIYS